MSDPRVFLGWDGPCLPRAAAWLRGRYTRGESCDMSGVIVALPGARAGRRLLELLAEAGGDLAPPRIVTAGSLPELLFDPDVRTADPLTALLARTFALRSTPREALGAIVPHPPEDHDLLAWLSLAGDLAALHEDLSGEGVSISDVITHGQKRVEFNDGPRWAALAQLHDAYLSALDARGLRDRHAARVAAAVEGRCRSEHDIILLAAADLPLNTRRMLRLAAHRVTPLIHAPPEEADSFDDLGCLRAERWSERLIEVPEEIIHIVDRPRDQAMQALRCIGALGAHHAADQITLGVGDEAMTSLLRRTLDLAELPVHAPVGRPVSQSRPALLLAGLAQFMGRQRLDDFAALLRHPDLEPFLISILDGPAGPAPADARPAAKSGNRPVRPEAPSTTANAIDHWLTLLDDYVNEHLLARSVGKWLGGEARAARLKAVHDAVVELVGSAARTPSAASRDDGPHSEAYLRRPLPNWCESIAAILAKVYAAVDFKEHLPEDADLLRAIEAIGGVLREQAALDPADDLTPKISLADAILFTLARLDDLETPDAIEPSGAAIELLGWLELQLDDAPALIITGFNEHHIPQSGGPDAFIPEGLRGAVGLLDNRRRYARDAAALTAILRSRPSVAIIAGRRGHDDEPLKPSRLLLTGDGAPLAQRILRFYPSDPAHSEPGNAMLLAVGGKNRFLIPAPKAPVKPLTEMRVTWFKTYLDCPYRFYLKHIAGLDAMSDQAVELDGLSYGTLAHEVFRRFGTGAGRDSTDADEIRRALERHLIDAAALRLGDEPPMAARLQLMQLGQRLGAFAHWQAGQAREGWRIVESWIECPVATEFDIDGTMVRVLGRIDRIDRHTRTGAYRIIDYKTGDTGLSPEQTHRRGKKGEKEWIDLQLPLYHRLAATLKIAGEIELGYVLLPKKLEDVGFVKADWIEEELEGAIDRAERVIRAIRGGVFWPPREAGVYEDEFSAICMEHYRGRHEVLREVGEGMSRR
jgi:hypothetical protein